MSKKNYEALYLEMVTLQEQDVVCASQTLEQEDIYDELWG